MVVVRVAETVVSADVFVDVVETVLLEVGFPGVTCGVSVAVIVDICVFTVVRRGRGGGGGGIEEKGKGRAEREEDKEVFSGVMTVSFFLGRIDFKGRGG